jgi:hypothetical protein
MDFDETWYLSFRKSVEQIEVLLKSDKNNGHFTWTRIHIFGNIVSIRKTKHRVKNSNLYLPNSATSVSEVSSRRNKSRTEDPLGFRSWEGNC